VSLFDDDDGISRREMLTLSGVAAFAIGTLTADSEEGALMPVGGGGANVRTATFGDWEVAITDSWEAYEIDRYPVVGMNTETGELRVFTGSVELPLRTTGKTMESIITSDIESIEINRLPALVFDTNKQEMRVFQEGDL